MNVLVGTHRLSKHTIARRAARASVLPLAVALVCLLTASATAQAAVTLDGTASSTNADDVRTVSWSHTIGTGTDRLLLVGVSWNCGTANRTIDSVTFTPTDTANYNEVVGTVSVQVNAPRKATDLSAATIAPIPDQAYTGKAIEPALTVTLAGAPLVAGTDYTTTYTANTNIGKATVAVTGIGAYTGSQTASFVIVPKKAKIAKLTAGVKRFTAKWSKQPGASGYELAYSTKKTSGFKTVTTTKASRTVTNLKSNKRYYVKLRSFVTINDTRHYGAWSNLKKVTVK